MNNMNVQRNYKDTIFRMLFKEKENLLSLYNALNGTTYTDTNGLEITTLENAIYMNYKNDVSFVFNAELMLYEHQSTVNPNMPLRDLIYVTKILQEITREEDLYSSTLIRLPVPKFVVFYNGRELQPERRTLKLSDAFEEIYPTAGGLSEIGEIPEEKLQSGLELIVTVFNINYGYNLELMDACHTLKEYALYVEIVRGYAKEMEFKEAVEKAVDYCIENDILRDFLKKNRAEAIAVSIFEYDEEKHIRNEKAISYEKGHETGYEEGHETGYEEGHQSGFKEGEETGSKKGLEKGIKGAVEMLWDLNHEESEIKTVIMEKYGLTEEEAEGYMQL